MKNDTKAFVFFLVLEIVLCAIVTLDNSYHNGQFVIPAIWSANTAFYAGCLFGAFMEMYLTRAFALKK